MSPGEAAGSRRSRRPAAPRAIALALAFGLPGLPAGGWSHESHDQAEPASPASAYAFPLPEPGTYRLPPIRSAAGGLVLTESGYPAELATLLKGRITVFSFIYTRCADICPVATMQLAGLRKLARAHSALDGRLRLVSMSFDPAHDTPAVMTEYGSAWREPGDGGAEWLFLTAPDQAALDPILAAYDQAVAPEPDPRDPGGGLAHMLRVFLIDADGMVRNIYSMDFLDPALVLNDVLTLAGSPPDLGPRPDPD